MWIKSDSKILNMWTDWIIHVYITGLSEGYVYSW